jgi:hypothetical protein
MKNLFMNFNFKVMLAFAAIYIIWGATYLTIKIGLQHMQPFTMAGLRFFMASLLLLTYSALKKQFFFSKNISTQLLLGAFMLGLGQGVIFWAEKYITSGLAAIVVSSLPIWYILLELLGGAIVCFLISLISGELPMLNFYSVPLRTWGVIAYLAIAGSTIAFPARNNTQIEHFII